MREKSSNHQFQRLQTDLAAIIQSIPPGGRLPSEIDLTKQLGASRATIREAIRTFEAQGLIHRRQGQGTFVVAPAHVLDAGLEVLESIESLAARIQLPVTMGNLDIRGFSADEQQAARLFVDPGTALIRISRVILAQESPVAYLVDLLPKDILSAEDLDRGFTGSILDLLLTRREPPLANSRTDICAVAARAEIAQALEIQRGDVLLLLEASLFTPDGRIVDYSYTYCLPGYFRFHVNRSVGHPLLMIDRVLKAE